MNEIDNPARPPATASRIRCFACGGEVADISGPVHKYMDSSPGCWAAFGEVCAREYSDPRYAANHRLTVDAYALQHPGQPSPRTIQSVAVHLVSLHLVIERDFEMERTTQLMQALTRHKAEFFWLVPPQHPASLTVRDVLDARTPRAHLQAVRDWSESTWQAWHHSHDQAREWARLVAR